MSEPVPETLVAAAPGNRAKVFVSYSRKDLAFAQMMVEALAQRGFDAFLDKTDIAPGEPWKERLAGLIATADTVVFAVSPDSVASAICGWELEESARLGKRIIPVVTRRISDADAPAALGRLNWVFLTEGDDKDAALATLDTALHTDLPWVREHTRLGELARHWDEQGRSAGATLRGADLEAAERWLDRRPADANAPTDLHQDFIRASRRAATTRQRYWVGGSLAVAAVAIALAVFAEISRREAQTQRERAEHTLTLATGTANSLVFDLAQKFRDIVGVPAATVKDILDRARELQDQLFGSGESNPSLRRSQAEALSETSITLLALGETQSALTAAQQAQEIFQALLAQQPDSTDFQRELSVSVRRGWRRADGAGQSAGRAGLLSGGPRHHGPPGEVQSRQRRLAARSVVVVRQGRRRAGGAGQSAGRADLLSGEPRHLRPPGEVRSRQCRLAARSVGFVREGRRRAGGAGQSAGRAGLLSGGPRHLGAPGEVRSRQCRLAARSVGSRTRRSATCRWRRAICRPR